MNENENERDYKHEFLERIEEALKSGKRFVISGGRRPNFWAEFNSDVLLHSLIAKMEVGQTLAVAGLDNIKVLKLDSIQEYSNGAKLQFKGI